jgi:ATP-dependent Clp protease protease subunit
MAITKQTMSELNAKHTGQPLEKIIADSDRDNWFNAKDALEYGFIDHIATNEASIAGGKK